MLPTVPVTGRTILIIAGGGDMAGGGITVCRSDTSIIAGGGDTTSMSVGAVGACGGIIIGGAVGADREFDIEVFAQRGAVEAVAGDGEEAIVAYDMQDEGLAFMAFGGEHRQAVQAADGIFASGEIHHDEDERACARRPFFRHEFGGFIGVEEISPQLHIR